MIEKSPGASHTLSAACESRRYPMMSSQPSPKLPKWIFFLTDAVLVVTAWFIASRNHGVLSSAAMFSIVACVIVGAIVGLVPLLLHYEQVKNETLDDRQRALEALASTLTTAAEQISIAAQGLHELTDLAQKNLKQAEQLPQKLQDKVTDLQKQLTAARDDERDEMKKELAALRAVDSERLAAIADKVQKTAAELSKLDSSAQKSLAAAQAAFAKAPETITTASSAALAEIESKLAARTATALAAIAELETKRVAKPAEVTPAAEAPAPAPDPGPPGGIERRKSYQRRGTDIGQHITPIVPPTSAPFAGNIVTLTPEHTGDTPEPFGITSASTKMDEAPAAPAETPSSESSVSAPVAEAAPAASTEATNGAAPVEEPKAVKKRAPRKPKPAEDAGAPLDLGIPEPAVAVVADESTQAAPDETAAPSSEAAISSDGATRLLVTAYIGIGNRLFIRGDGPGLTWDKGVPLQFVSIGKWRWESSEATAPVKFKLYKNDETESAALGTQTLDSGRQQEVTATF